MRAVPEESTRTSIADRTLPSDPCRRFAEHRIPPRSFGPTRPALAALHP